MTETNLDKPLPEVSQQGENNTIFKLVRKQNQAGGNSGNNLFYFHRTTTRTIDKKESPMSKLLLVDDDVELTEFTFIPFNARRV